MENEGGSTHLKPQILPPLGAQKVTNETGKVNLKTNLDKPLRQRIGTPAPQKKSPIPDDLDLDNIDGRRGNPAIKVESCKAEDMQRSKYHILPEKTLKSLPEDAPVPGINTPSSRPPKKPQLQPIMNPIFNIKNQDDFNGNDVNRRRSCDAKIISSEIPPPGKIHLPNKYAPLKPIVRKKSALD